MKEDDEKRSATYEYRVQVDDPEGWHWSQWRSCDKAVFDFIGDDVTYETREKIEGDAK